MSDLLAIDQFFALYGNRGISHPNLGADIVYYDTNEEIKIEPSAFDKNAHYHHYFVNYDEIMPYFDFGLFFNEISDVLSGYSQGYREQLDDFLKTYLDTKTKKIKLYEIKQHFIAINQILSRFETVKFHRINAVQNCIIDLFLDLYQKEIKHLDWLIIEYSEFGESIKNSVALKSVIQNMISEKTESISDKILDIEISQNSELLSREEAIKYLHTSPTSLWRWEDKGYIKSYMIGGKKLFKKQELTEALQQVS